MSAGPRFFLWFTTAAAAVTGAVYGYLHYVLENDDPFSAYNHLLEPYALEGESVSLASI